MTLAALKTLFRGELSEMYTTSETDQLFEIFCEAWLGLTRYQLRNQTEHPVDPETGLRLMNGMKQLKKGTPYQQILGKAEFFGLTFCVDRNVLIPRPETEELVEMAISELKNLAQQRIQRRWADGKTSAEKPLRIIDIGTGSGAIAISLKKHFPEAKVVALDYSEEALQVATKNAGLHKVDIHFHQVDYLNSKLEGYHDLIISNPPYIGRDETDEIADSVKEFEPKMALFSPTADPLIFYRKIAADAVHHLAERGLILLEINQKLGPETLALFKDFPCAELLKDLSGNDRFIRVRTNNIQCGNLQ